MSTTVAAPHDTGIPTGTWAVDPTHSTIGFAVKHSVVATFRGAFSRFEGALAGGAAPRVHGSVDATSVEVKDENLAGHLQSPEFFDVERHPQLTFESTAIARSGADVVVDGTITIKGTTRPVQLRGEITGPAAGIDGTERLGVSLNGTVDRTAFGLDFNAPLPGGGLLVSNDVRLELELELVQEAGA